MYIRCAECEEEEDEWERDTWRVTRWTLISARAAVGIILKARNKVKAGKRVSRLKKHVIAKQQEKHKRFSQSPNSCSVLHCTCFTRSQYEGNNPNKAAWFKLAAPNCIVHAILRRNAFKFAKYVQRVPADPFRVRARRGARTPLLLSLCHLIVEYALLSRRSGTGKGVYFVLLSFVIFNMCGESGLQVLTHS